MDFRSSTDLETWSCTAGHESNT